MLSILASIDNNDRVFTLSKTCVVTIMGKLAKVMHVNLGLISLGGKSQFCGGKSHDLPDNNYMYVYWGFTFIYKHATD